MRQGRGRKGGEKSQNREYMQPHTYDQQNRTNYGNMPPTKSSSFLVSYCFTVWWWTTTDIQYESVVVGSYSGFIPKCLVCLTLSIQR